LNCLLLHKLLSAVLTAHVSRMAFSRLFNTSAFLQCS
jgi:hypothetical protein